MPLLNSLNKPPAPISNIRTRDPKKLMTTTYGNEIATVVNKSFGMPPSGQLGRLQTQQGYFDAQVVIHGPNNEADLAGNWYWVKPFCFFCPVATNDFDVDVIKQDLQTKEDLTVTGERDQSDTAIIVPAYLESKSTGSRILSEGDLVRVAWREVMTMTGAIGIYLIESAPSSGTIPIGQYPGMFWGMVTNNQAAYAYPFAIQTVL